MAWTQLNHSAYLGWSCLGNIYFRTSSPLWIDGGVKVSLDSIKIEISIRNALFPIERVPKWPRVDLNAKRILIFRLCRWEIPIISSRTLFWRPQSSATSHYVYILPQSLLLRWLLVGWLVYWTGWVRERASSSIFDGQNGATCSQWIVLQLNPDLREFAI